MKVCMLTTYPPQKCGVGDYTFELCNALAKNKEMKIDVLTFKTHKKPERKNSTNIDVHRKINIDSNPEFIAKQIKRFNQILFISKVQYLDILINLIIFQIILDIYH